MSRSIAVSTAFILLSCIILFITCKKEYSYEGGASNGSATGTAVYTLAGAGGSCAGVIVNGNYYSGIALTSTNTVLLQVNVITTGTYNISTNSVNGFHFSGSGNFTATGIQAIILTGSGTPAAEGNFTFKPPIDQGCSFIVEVKKATAAIASFTLTGAPDTCQGFILRGSYISGVPLVSSNTVDVNINVTAIGNYTLTTDTLDGIWFSKSGTFTTTGNQKITLIGNGTPGLARNLSFTILSATSNCTFAVSIINPEPLAIYVLESGFGDPNPCTYSISGAYNVNSPLSNSNTVSVRVYVVYLGNFTIATNQVNGMNFSYTGTFTTIGSQNVILSGSGTPAATGTYTFIPEIVGPHPLGGQACAFFIAVN